MRVDPDGRLFFSFLFFSIILGAVLGGAINAYSAYKEGANLLGIFGAVLGGVIMGGAMGAVMAIDGAAGMVSLGLASFSFGLSAGAALGISLGIGVGAGLLSYTAETLLRSYKDWNWGDFALSGVMGSTSGINIWTCICRRKSGFVCKQISLNGCR